MAIKAQIAGLMMGLMVLSVPMVYADSGTDEGKSMDQKSDWHHGDHDQMMAKILNLTEDQQKQLKDNTQKQRELMKGIFEQMKTAKEAFDMEIVKASPDMSKVSDIQNQVKALQSQMLDNHLNGILAIKKILTPEQFAGYMALKKERMLKKGMMGHGKFRSKDGFGKAVDGHKAWGGKEDGTRDSEYQNDED